MLKKTIGVAVAALAAGCATIQLSSAGAMKDGERLLAIQNDGYMLLGVVPLASGSLIRLPTVRSGKSTHPVFFANHADTQHLYAMALKVAERENCDLKDVEFIDNSTQLDLTCAYGLVTHDDVAVSAVLVPRK